jgi:hypothetical protein
LLQPVLTPVSGSRASSPAVSFCQTISALGTLAAGLAGGEAGDSTGGAVAGAQAGKNASSLPPGYICCAIYSPIAAPEAPASAGLPDAFNVPSGERGGRTVSGGADTQADDHERPGRQRGGERSGEPPLGSGSGPLARFSYLIILLIFSISFLKSSLTSEAGRPHRIWRSRYTS